MLSLLSTLGGLLISGLPRFLDFFQAKADQSHEREMAKIQTERELSLAAQGFAAQQRIEEIRTDQVALQTEAQMQNAALAHDEKLIAKLGPKMTAYMGSVRPTVTYIFVLELVGINIAMIAYAWLHPGIITDFNSLMAFTDKLFSEDEMAMLGGIIGFWFGTRGWSKK